MNLELENTIVAISSGLKNAAIGVIRISGSTAIDLLRKVFIPFNKNFREFESHRAYFGKLMKNNEFIDEVVVIVYRAPKSYTGEDVVEINCHGNLILMQKIVNMFLEMGCRLAKPGEFTLRAVLNKKIDLSKAFAIRDVIEANTEKMLSLSLKNLQGQLSSIINSIKERLIYWIGWVEALFDFPEEDIPSVNFEDLKQDVFKMIQDIEKVISSFDASKFLREGIDTVIVGKPNVGKSTLFNYLYGQERVIISDIPGTTRDIISEYINLDGVLVKLYDTAGFRKTSDLIEKIGIEKAKEIIAKAKLVFWVLEYDSLDDDDFEAIKNAPNFSKVIIVINKIDKENEFQKIKEFEEKIIKVAKEKLNGNDFGVVSCSLKTNFNLETLKEKIHRLMGINDDVILIDTYQYEILKKVLFYLRRLLDDFHMSQEIVAVNLREALASILELMGENISDVVIDNMLSRFCIGK